MFNTLSDLQKPPRNQGSRQNMFMICTDTKLRLPFPTKIQTRWTQTENELHLWVWGSAGPFSPTIKRRGRPLTPYIHSDLDFISR